MVVLFMPTQKKRFNTIDAYIKTFPPHVQLILQKIRQTIRKAAPEVVETISYQMPAFNLKGRYLVYVGAWKSHVGLYPIPTGNEAFRRELSPYKGAKSSARFPIEEPIPYGLVRKIVMLRMKENQEKEEQG